MASRLRVGIVDYLNSKPLAWDFLCGRLEDRYEALYRPPARVADLLRRGEIDVGLIPTIEYQRIPDLVVVPSGCVAARKAVRSVLLVSQVPFSKISTLALDQNSRTSAVLVQILLKERYGVEPEVRPAKPDLSQMLVDADAALVIGDPALRITSQDGEVMDLASEWCAHTGLPFVFAFWAARRDAVSPELAVDLASSLEHGLESLDEIADRTAVQLNLDRKDLQAYLRGNLSFTLGAEELAGVEEYFRRAYKHGLIDRPRLLELAAD